jgi:hypothetical protein
MTRAMPPHLVQLEAESIAIMRETVAEKLPFYLRHTRSISTSAS